MAKSVLELAVGTGQWDAGLKKAKSALDNFTQANGGLQKALSTDSDKMQQFVKMMGQMDSTAKTAKGQMNDYKGAIEQLTMQYNRMTDAQKQTIGQDYLRAIDQMKQKYQGVAEEVQKINQSLSQTPKADALSSAMPSGGSLFGGGKLDGMLQVFGGNVMTKVAGMGAGFVSELGDMVKQGIELARAGEGVRIAFERLGRGDLLDGLRQATHGTVTDLELMKAAVKFNDFKLPVEELGTMLAFAQQKAKDTGQSVDYMVDSIVTGLGRKSLMILDNLGLSAAEIKDKMKETGDMTKAVGEIIREQMAKAGDYVETAADRATKANVELENAMTRLGETFQPLSDSANSMWTNIKVGALDLLNNAIRPLIDAFTKAGRARALYEQQGGDARVNRQLDRLKGIQTDSYRQGTYKAQLRNYDTQIASHEQYLKDYKAWQSDNTNVGAYDRMQKFKQQTGLEWVSDVQAHLDAFKKMRSEYVQGAKAILEANPVPSPTTTTTTTTPTKTTPTTTTNNAPTYAADSIAAQQAMVNELSKQWNEAGSEFRNDYLVQLIAAEEVLKRMKNEATLIRENSAGKLLGGDVETSGLGSVTGTNKTVKITGLDKEALKNATNLQNMGKSVTDSWRDAASAVQSVGSALSGLDDPGAKIIGTIGQAIASIALGFAQATAADSKLGVFGWIAAIAGGMATMVSTISAIHSATGYSEGGIIKGTTFSGDQIMANGGSIGLNAGELVLNRAQQNTLAGMLDNNRQSSGSGNGVARVSGEQIYIAVNNYLRRSGKGELVTWR